MKLNLIIAAIFLCSFQTNNNSITKSEILWDTWGIPHIYGQSEADAYYLMGWAQMRNHGDLILKLYGEARGLSASYWEDGDAKRDRQLHLLGLVENSNKLYGSMSLEEKVIADGFAEGINAFAKKYPEAIDDKFEVVLPIRPQDVIAHSFRVFYLEFLINRPLGQAGDWSPGSNAWAVNKSKTANGNSLLLANPHLPWVDFWLFFEAHLITDQNDLYGATLVGMPTIGIGFNKHLGWTHTVNTIDNVDLYEIKIKDNQYLMDDEWHQIEEVLITYSSEKVVRKTTAFGIIMKEENDKALVVRYPNMDGTMNIFKQWDRMGKAKNLNEFQAALEINTIPLFNVIYADKGGNILYHFGGNVPIKNGDWDRWQDIVKTSSSKDIWDEYYDYESVPSYINPPSHWIQNANDPPYTSTVPYAIDPDDYPDHIAPNDMTFRPQRSATLIGDAKALTLESFIELKHDTKSQMAIRLEDDFEELAEMTDDEETLAAINILKNWDGSYEANSKGALLFTNIVMASREGTMFKDAWDYDNPLSTPDGFRDPEMVLKLIKSTAASLTSKLGAVDIPYGHVFRVKVGEFEFPGNGGFGQLGIFRTMNYSQAPDGKFFAFHGDSFVCTTEFGENIRAKAILGYGNATQPGNKHVGDQLELYSKKKLRDVWLSKTEQEEHLELREGME